MRIFAATILLLVSLPAWGGPNETETVGDLHGHSAKPLEGEGIRVETTRTTYPLVTEGLADRIATEGRYDLRLLDGAIVPLVLQEVDIFAPGEKYVLLQEPDGTELKEPIRARTFEGYVEPSRAPVFLTVAPEGLYASFNHAGAAYSIQPISWENGVVTQEIVRDLVFKLDGSAVPLESVPLPASSLSTTSNGYWTIYVKPVGEYDYRILKYDWQNWIIQSYGYALQMWRTEAPQNDVALLAIVGANRNYLEAANPCGAGYDVGLISFAYDYVSANFASGANAYGLFHGSYHDQDSIGCAFSNCDGYHLGCLQPWWAGSVVPEASHSVQAIDLYSTDPYDATRIDHVGKLTAHELTHNAGQNGHPPAGWCWTGTQHLMADKPITCLGAFRTTETQNYVTTYTHDLVLQT